MSNGNDTSAFEPWSLMGSTMDPTIWGDPASEMGLGMYGPNVGGMDWGALGLDPSWLGTDPTASIDPGWGLEFGTDPSMANALANAPLGGLGLTRPPLAGSAPPGGGQGPSPMLLGLTGPQIGAGLMGLGAVGGLIGLFQSMAAGAPVKKEVVTKAVAEASPEEKALLARTVAQLAQVQGMAGQAEIQRAIQQLASGQLAITPDLVSQVTKVFTNAAGQAVTAGVESARQRGFAGGTELAFGPGHPVTSNLMSAVTSDINRALTQLGLAMPAQAAQMHQTLSGTQMAPILAQTDLLRTLGAQRGGMTTGISTGQEPTLLQSLAQLGPFLQAMGQMGYAFGGMGGGQGNPRYAWGG